MSETKKLDLPTAKTWKGIAYGPGTGIDVPAEAAEAWQPKGKAKAKAETKATTGGKK